MGTKKEIRLQRIADGICVSCGKNSSVPSKTECESCAKKRRDRDKARYHRAGKNKIAARRKQYKKEGLCSRCGKNKPATDLLTCQDCLDRQTELNNLVKDQVYEAYGGYICNCCGESIKEFLTLDHINNDGAIHRKEVFGGRSSGSHRTLYKWIIDNNFPPIFQVLCANCNWGKRMNGGICPHQTGK